MRPKRGAAPRAPKAHKERGKRERKARVESSCVCVWRQCAGKGERRFLLFDRLTSYRQFVYIYGMFEWDEQKRLKTLHNRHLDFKDTWQVFDGRPVVHLPCVA